MLSSHEQPFARGQLTIIPEATVLYRSRNAIERMFGRIKDFRRIAIRYDRNAACSPPSVYCDRQLSVAAADLIGYP